MNLLAVQRAFHAGLLSEEGLPQTGTTPRFRTGFAIYRNAYRARLMACLRESYDRVWSWIGDEAFDRAAIHHLILHPPHSWSLDDAGAGFDRTLAGLFPAEPEVAELAWLEWQMQLAFRSCDEPPLDPLRFAELTSGFDDRAWEAMRLRLGASVTIRKVTTACADIWAAIDHKVPPASPLALEFPASLLVWRKELHPRFRTLPPEEAAALGWVLQGECFAAVCASHASADAVPAVGAMLGRWIADGLVIDLR
jgi:Putative DNA-binding domain